MVQYGPWTVRVRSTALYRSSSTLESSVLRPHTVPNVVSGVPSDTDTASLWCGDTDTDTAKFK